jgi:hypothetical protein
MKLFPSVLSTFLAAGFIQTALGLKCNSGCTACWLKYNANGVNTKFACTGTSGKDYASICPPRIPVVAGEGYPGGLI